MRVDQLKPGTYFTSNGTSFLYDRSRRISRCWDGGYADAGFRTYPDTDVEVVSAERASELARRALQLARLE